MTSAPSGSPALVDPAWISAHLDDPGVRLIEVDVSPADYEKGHIPGAFFWNAYRDLRDSDYMPVSREQLQGMLSRAGITAGTTLVFYGFAGALGFWLARAHGHRDVRVMEGERDRWAAAGGEWSTEAPDPAPTSYRLPPASPELEASREALAAAIDDPDTVILDVRSELEFAGERFWPSGATDDAGRAGHVPGAVNIPIDRFRADDRTLRGREVQRRALEENDVTPARKVIVYCTIGNRAAQVWFGMTHLLGYHDVRLYYASWVEWGRRTDTPVET
jgi:thiosulfate/3-mercaptopyruvate sulfurtransferase